MKEEGHYCCKTLKELKDCGDWTKMYQHFINVSAALLQIIKHGFPDKFRNDYAGGRVD